MTQTSANSLVSAPPSGGSHDRPSSMSCSSVPPTNREHLLDEKPCAVHSRYRCGQDHMARLWDTDENGLSHLWCALLRLCVRHLHWAQGELGTGQNGQAHLEREAEREGRSVLMIPCARCAISMDIRTRWNPGSLVPPSEAGEITGGILICGGCWNDLREMEATLQRVSPVVGQTNPGSFRDESGHDRRKTRATKRSTESMECGT